MGDYAYSVSCTATQNSITVNIEITSGTVPTTMRVYCRRASDTGPDTIPIIDAINQPVESSKVTYKIESGIEPNTEYMVNVSIPTGSFWLPSAVKVVTPSATEDKVKTYIYRNGWKPAQPYIFINGSWKPATVHIYKSGWK